jgi:choline dehydrogenase-like flavoprotein
MNVRNLGEAGHRGVPMRLSGQRLARPGTHLVDGDASEMPAAAHSSNVGGMGAYWSCATPRPAGTELIHAIPGLEWDRLVTRAEQLLSTRASGLPMTAGTRELVEALGQRFDRRLSGGRKVAPMPLACVPPSDPRGPIWWAGTDSVLGPLADGTAGHSGRFVLRAETVCQRLVCDGGRISGAILQHVPSATSFRVSASVVVVAADALRTPQLLWASGVRPPALGRHLNDQPQLIGTAPGLGRSRERNDRIGVFWIPFDDAGHPYHGQVMQTHSTSLGLLDDRAPIPQEAPPLVLIWFCRKDIRSEDRVEFSAADLDGHGLPRPTIRYGLSGADTDAIRGARAELELAAAALGGLLDEPTLLPAGSSLHYQGTVRIGERDDGESVCDSYSRVWGFENLYVGGNGVISTATACNPTLTSVALAVRSAERIAETLHRSRIQHQTTS